MWKEEERYKDKEREGGWQVIKGKRGREKLIIKWHKQKETEKERETTLHRQKEIESTKMEKERNRKTEMYVKADTEWDRNVDEDRYRWR